MSVSLDSLQAFSVFAEELNFTKAARNLFISQPALHIKIKKLSQQLGVKLYTKTGRRLQLTDYGKEVARFARETTVNLDLFLHKLKGTEPNQAVTLAAGTGCYLYLLGNAIRQFRKKSKSQLRLFSTNRQQTIEFIETGKAALGVTVLDEKPIGMTTRILRRVPSLLVVAKNSPLANRRSVGVRNLNDLPLIVPPKGRAHRATIDALLESKGVHHKVAIEADGWELAIQFAGFELGGAIVNGICKLPRTVVGIPIHDFPSMTYYLLFKRNITFHDDQNLLKELIQHDIR